jgi:DNA segregation ATPase FtsK/SpoIIIE-like protein
MCLFVKNFVYDMRYQARDIDCYYPYDPYTHPHTLICGPTGSGKTILSKLLLGKIGLYIPAALVTALDYKGFDFKFLEGCANYCAYDACADGLMRFYERMQARQKGAEAVDRPLFLFVDEWAAFVNSIPDKKEQERAKAMLASVLMIGRGLHCFLIVAVQRADAALFAGGARDNFSRVVALGNISKEAKEMLFRDFRDEMTELKQQGEGFMALDGQPLAHIVVPHISDHGMAKLHDAIREVVNRE